MPDYIYAYQGKFIAPSSGKVIGKPVDPYNPLGLPPYTMRLKFAEGYDPSVNLPLSEWTLVDSTENIWDGKLNNGNKAFPPFQNNTYLLECISANMRNDMSSGFITSFQNKFNGCSNLVSVSLPCTDHVTRMDSMFKGCTSLTSIPATLDTAACTNMSNMFNGCVNVQSGALALYQQASTQTTPPSRHTKVFTNCGSNTVTGAAELAQIPTSWGGTMA